MKSTNKLTLYIMIAMLTGGLVGYIVFVSASSESRNSFATDIKLLTTIFLRLVQMIIAPLVFCTLVVGIAKLGDLKTVGRVGGKAMVWFLSASITSLLLGMLLVNLLKPGVGIDLANASADSVKTLQAKRSRLRFRILLNMFSRKASWRRWQIMRYYKLLYSLFSLVWQRQQWGLCKTAD